jgi:L-ribulose-5-phosphate 4-epimerase
MLDDLKTQVCQANLDLVKDGLVTRTFGNVSGLDRASNRMVIKPSGVAYSEMRPEHMVVVDLQTGAVTEGTLRPSSDTPTHLELYRAFPQLGGIAHTHSLLATAWAQAVREIPALGTTHADYFYGPIPCTRLLTDDEITTDYESNTGKVILEAFSGRDPLACPAVIVANHGPFAWGKTPAHAADNAFALEYVARLAAETMRIFAFAKPMPDPLMNKHFFRKHGPAAYYGQGLAPGVTGEPKT